MLSLLLLLKCWFYHLRFRVYRYAQQHLSWWCLAKSWKIQGSSRLRRHRLATHLEIRLENRLESIWHGQDKCSECSDESWDYSPRSPQVSWPASRCLLRTCQKYQSPTVVEVLKLNSWQWKVGIVKPSTERPKTSFVPTKIFQDRAPTATTVLKTPSKNFEKMAKSHSRESREA